MRWKNSSVCQVDHWRNLLGEEHDPDNKFTTIFSGDFSHVHVSLPCSLTPKDGKHHILIFFFNFLLYDRQITDGPPNDWFRS